MEQGTDLSEYERPDLGRSILDIATSVVPYLALTGLMYAIYDQVSVLVILALAHPRGRVLAPHVHPLSRLRARLVLRLEAREPLVRALLRAARLAAVLHWRHDHAVHHGSAGDLDRRGTGDVPTLTVEEYYGRDWRGRLGYRLFRNPLVMFGIGPICSLMVAPRRIRRQTRPAAQQRPAHQRRARGDHHRDLPA